MRHMSRKTKKKAINTSQSVSDIFFYDHFQVGKEWKNRKTDFYAAFLNADHYSLTIRTIRRLFALFADYSPTIRTIRRLFALFADYSHYSQLFSFYQLPAQWTETAKPDGFLL